MKINLRKDETLVLRTCAPDGTSRRGFRWPKRGPVKCNDWHPRRQCGHGLHGALLGNGEGSLFYWREDASELWQIVKVKKNEIVNLGGKVKFPRGYVLFTGSQKRITDILCKNGYQSVIGSSLAVSDYQTASVGYKGVARTGKYGIAVCGNKGKAISKNCAISVSGSDGESIAGNQGVSLTGRYGKAKSGLSGLSISLNNGFSKSGEYGHSISGVGGTAQAGDGGIIQITYYSGAKKRILVGYIGEDGLLPNTKYGIYNGKFVKVS